MSRREKGDWENTVQLVKKMGGKVVEDKSNESWLRHREKSQAAFIDWMILEAHHTKEDIAQAIKKDPNLNKKKQSLETLITRVQKHIDHLQDKDDGGKSPHLCDVEEKMGGGVVRFKVKKEA